MNSVITPTRFNSSPIDKEHIVSCSICGKTLTGKQLKFCSAACKGKDGNNKRKSYSAQRKRAIDTKLHFIMKKGGQCAHCGYNKNVAALCFHHLHDKDFRLDSRHLSNRSREKIELEMSKCQLLCHNCHMELHYPEYSGILTPTT